MYAVISDIHANAAALDAVLERVQAEGISRIVCLGDVVGYCAEPNQCVQRLRQCGAACVLGNHDRVAAGAAEPVGFGQWGRRAVLWTRQQLTGDNMQFLRGLPLKLSIDAQTLAVHGSPYPQPNDQVRLSGLEDAKNAFASLRANFPQVRVCFFGHTHRAAVYRSLEGRTSAVVGDQLQLQDRGCYLINPGTVGMPRDRGRQAQFAIYDPEKQLLRFRRVDYSWAQTYRKAVQAGIVYRPSLAVRLADWVGVWGTDF